MREKIPIGRRHWPTGVTFSCFTRITIQKQRRMNELMKPPETERRFEEYLRQHRGILFKVCNLYAAFPEDREDLAQEILVQLWRTFPNFDGRCAYSTWMYRVSLNTAISWLRHDSLRLRHSKQADERLIANVPAAEIDSDELRLLYGLINQLEPLQKALMMMHLDGNSHQEIAEVLGITPSNVATRINRLKNDWKQQASQPGERL